MDRVYVLWLGDDYLSLDNRIRVGVFSSFDKALFAAKKKISDMPLSISDKTLMIHELETIHKTLCFDENLLIEEVFIDEYDS